MTKVEEMISVAVSTQQAMRLLVTTARFADWVSPDITVTPLTAAPRLSPGDRFRLSLLGGLTFEYLLEAETEREIVFAFTGPWRGEERWSFIADGSDTIIRRRYEVRDGATLALLAWETVGRAIVLAHLKLELSRFRAIAEREPGVRAEIEHRPSAPQGSESRGYPIDEG
ncbi:MAG: hypothetical protein H7Z74_07290 [Anaerolineae bacterium]|nr:hypothetical protein [Gemmatimonadaceae bacterium]